jgi:hypothetical protein
MIISQSVLLPAPGAASSSVHVPVGGFPNVLTTYKLSKGLGITIEELISGYNSEYLSVAEREPTYESDSLSGVLSSNQTLKELVWRIVQCNALQLRTIGTMLTSWGIGFYDTNGNLSKLEG